MAMAYHSRYWKMGEIEVSRSNIVAKVGDEEIQETRQGAAVQCYAQITVSM